MKHRKQLRTQRPSALMPQGLAASVGARPSSCSPGEQSPQWPELDGLQKVLANRVLIFFFKKPKLQILQQSIAMERE